jgi:hypothetical protein
VNTILVLIEPEGPLLDVVAKPPSARIMCPILTRQRKFTLLPWSNPYQYVAGAVKFTGLLHCLCNHGRTLILIKSMSGKEISS